MATFTLWLGAWSLLTTSLRELRPGRSPEVRGSRVHRRRQLRPGLPIAESVQHAVHVVLTTQPLKEGDEVQQLRVRHVIEPGLHRHCILRMEDVRGRRIVNNDHFAQLPSQATQVLDIVPSMENTGFSEESGPEHTPAVQEVSHRVCILSQAGSKEHTLEELSHPLEKFIHMWPLQHIHLMYSSIDFDRNNKISITNRLK